MQNLSVRSWCALRPAAIGKNLKLVFNLRAGMVAVSVEENSDTNMIMLGLWLLQRVFILCSACYGMMAVSMEEHSETNMIMLVIWLLQRFYSLFWLL